VHSRALILFAHGARDARWAEPFLRLQRLIAAQLPEVEVALAYLELMQPSLPDLVDRFVQGGCRDVTVVPVFLGRGGHVARDLPLLADGLRNKHLDLTLRVAGAVGEDADVLAAMARYCVGALMV
jgi:sirohydrochlorin cobaltochelatase